jgi:L-rhamnose isomerase
MSNRYESAKEMYAAIGVDTDAAIKKLKDIPVSLHCWQGDDVTGFDHDGPLTGGIQTTGNYPGKARTPDELMADMDKVMSRCPGTKKLNVHACYAIFEPGEFVDRDKLEPKHFAKWVEFAKKNNVGIDFNPTFFSHPNMKDGLTLSSPDEDVRKFWIEHGKACVRISQYFAEETGMPCVMNTGSVMGSKMFLLTEWVRACATNSRLKRFSLNLMTEIWLNLALNRRSSVSALSHIQQVPRSSH